MTNYVFDAPNRRDWRKLVDDVAECSFDKQGGRFLRDGDEILDGVVIAHRSRLYAQDIAAEVLEAYCDRNWAVTVIVVTGGVMPEQPGRENLYYRKAAVGDSDGDLFGGCLRRFTGELRATGTRNFRLLEPVLSDAPHAVALAILCQGYLIAVGAEPEATSKLAKVTARSSAVKDPRWWLKPFDGRFPAVALVTELSQELPDDVQDLEKELARGQPSTVTVQKTLESLRAIFNER